MFERVANYTNNSSNDQIVWLEPWCESLTIPAGTLFSFIGRGNDDGEIEIENRNEGIVVYGWPSSVIRVECNGVVLWEAYSEVPPIPPDMKASEFIKFMFYQPMDDKQPGK
jgi:hypothetical protein